MLFWSINYCPPQTGTICWDHTVLLAGPECQNLWAPGKGRSTIMSRTDGFSFFQSVNCLKSCPILPGNVPGLLPSCVAFRLPDVSHQENVPNPVSFWKCFTNVNTSCHFFQKRTVWAENTCKSLEHAPSTWLWVDPKFRCSHRLEHSFVLGANSNRGF